MAYFKLPKDWTEDDCNRAIDKLIESGMKQLDTENFEHSAKSFLQLVRIIRSIPELRRKTIKKEKLIHQQQKQLKRQGIVREEYIKEMLEK